MKLIISLLFILSSHANYLVMVKDAAHPFLNNIAEKKVLMAKPFYIFSVEREPNFKNSEVFIVEKNQETFLLNNLPQDELYHWQWALDNRGDNEPRRGGGRIPIPGVIGSDIGIKNAWSKSLGKNKVVVAVVDTGIDHEHEDIRSQMWINEVEKNGLTGIDDDGNGFVDDIHGYDLYNNNSNPMDDNKHGTHVAGIIGAKHNRVGIAGVNNNVSLMAVKYMDKKGRGNLEGAIKATKYAVENGAKIINNSWGMLKESKILKEYFEYAGREYGVTFVAAAGNNYKNLDVSPLFPAAFKIDNQITVAALNPENRMTGFSCYGATTVHVAAPGRNIMSTVPGNKYEVLSGTSMSAPYVAGALSLLLSQNKELKPSEMIDKVISSSVYVPHFEGRTISEGRLDISNLLDM